ncbi:MAG: LacI family DNA-binding transcriptional regulator, partial [Mariniphaga sp.]|nr:LacI family DNA-binding transcriptional regulator [Mariniphaga sp.]
MEILKMGKSNRTTMNDIAEKAGVSQATVSFVLNNRTNSGVKISEATKQKVLDAAEKLNYSLNDAAKALVTGHFSTIQLFISDITDPFFGEFIHGVEKVALEKGYKILLRSTEFSKNLEKKSFSALQSSMVDGVI